MADPESRNVSNVDDLNSVNAFLARIGGSQVTVAQYRNPTPPPQESQTPSPDVSVAVSEHVSDAERETHGVDSHVTSVAASPDPGRRAPPSTPAYMRNAATILTNRLEPVLEDHTSVLVALAEHSNQNLMDSKHAFARPESLLLNKTRAALTIKSPNTTAIKRFSPPESQKALAEKMKNVNFQDDVLQSFKEKSENMTTSSDDVNHKIDVVETLSKVEGNTISEDDDGVSRSSDTAPFPTFNDHSSAVPSPVTHNEVAMTSIEMARSTQKLKDLLVVEAGRSRLVEKSTDPAQTTVTVPDVDANGNETPIVLATPVESHKEEDPEDREHLTHFRTWGAVAPRSTPKARPRKVILTGLPVNADNTLVASLLHGGTIETFRLFTPSETATTKNATVLFTDADAAQKYYDDYPNGVSYQFGNRKCAALVEIGKEVDVLSSLLRGHLEAGASRVVRATGADEDWGMRALSKLAEGKGRKVEGIADYWRDEIRTIVFRFTNIPDAVQFRGQLFRDYDWETCNIQFMDDPCAKATGVHVDS